MLTLLLMVNLAIDYVLCHRCPPEISSDVLCGFELAEMANYCVCMINDNFDHLPPVMKGITGYTEYILFE